MKFQLSPNKPAYLNTEDPRYKEYLHQEFVDSVTKRTTVNKVPTPTYFDPNDVLLHGKLFTTNEAEMDENTIWVNEVSLEFIPVDDEARAWAKAETARAKASEQSVLPAAEVLQTLADAAATQDTMKVFKLNTR